jgi:hypothetical protein
MKPQKQPNKWSCLATSFAVILGVDVRELFDEIGFDGSEKVWPDNHRRGHHPNELILCSLRRGWSVTPIEFRPALLHPTTDQVHELDAVDFPLTGCGVLGLRNPSHAVAFIDPVIFDPACKLMYLKDTIEIYYKMHSGSGNY